MPGAPRKPSETFQKSIEKLIQCPDQIYGETLTCLNQTGECFLLTSAFGRQDVNNKNSHGMGRLGRSVTDQPRNGSTTAPSPKSCRQQVEMCCCCALLLDFDSVDMLNKVNQHVCCKAPSSSVCPSCLRQDNQSRSQSLFDVKVACLHVALFFSCCRGRVWPDVLTDLPFLKRRSTPKSVWSDRTHCPSGAQVHM